MTGLLGSGRSPVTMFAIETVGVCGDSELAALVTVAVTREREPLELVSID